MTEAPYSGERRPIAAREWKLSQRIAEFLARSGASPNGISVAGAVFGILGGFAFAATSAWPAHAWWLWLVVAVMMQLRLQCNLYDGMVAIATGRASPVGELYNDVPDRISDSAFLIGAGYALHSNVSLGYAAALAAMFTAYIRAVGKAGGARQEFCGPMAKQQRMALLTVTALLCAFAPNARLPAFGSAPEFGILTLALFVIAVGSLITSVRRLLRIAEQLRETPLREHHE
ncbi:MAG: CDP-alcohol phosphatidyltransferase family protein [Planctomycetia bacterium]|nr:CDP-alcohol phosphatidyltransferase family protein [Planctomycetia bacterium]